MPKTVDPKSLALDKDHEQLVSGLTKLKKHGWTYLLDPDLKAACVSYMFCTMDEKLFKTTCSNALKLLLQDSDSEEEINVDSDPIASTCTDDIINSNSTSILSADNHELPLTLNCGQKEIMTPYNVKNNNLKIFENQKIINSKPPLESKSKIEGDRDVDSGFASFRKSGLFSNSISPPVNSSENDKELFELLSQPPKLPHPKLSADLLSTNFRSFHLASMNISSDPGQSTVFSSGQSRKRGLEAFDDDYISIPLRTGKFQCHVCDKQFKEALYLRRHMDIHVNNRKYKCDECGKGFNQYPGLYSHKKNVHGSRINSSLHNSSNWIPDL